jgi:hypothetical protein
LLGRCERWMLAAMQDPREGAAERPNEDKLLEAAYRAEFSPGSDDPAEVRQVAERRLRVGELRGLAIDDLATRVAGHSLLRRADDTARMAALRFVERRLSEGEKVSAYDESGSFNGFLRRVVSNLLLDWLRSPTGKAELRRAEHDGIDSNGPLSEPPEEMELPREEFERNRRLSLHHLVALRCVQSMPPGRGIPLRVSLWPGYEHEVADVLAIGSFAHCHETAGGQAESRACDAGKRCTTPDDAWRAAYGAELDKAKSDEPAGLSRRAVAVVLRIGLGKPMAKREGAVCERISKGRLQLIAELRRAGIRGSTT